MAFGKLGAMGRGMGHLGSLGSAGGRDLVPTQRAIGVYGQNDASTVTDFETLTGRSMDIVTAFFNQSSLANFTSSISFITSTWAGRSVDWAVPIPSGVTLAQINAGTYDSTYTGLFQSILAVAPAGSLIWIRPPWEANLASQPWTAVGNEAAYKAAFQRIVTLGRAVSSRFRFTYCLNFSSGADTVDYAAMDPGRAYLDARGIDIYWSPGVDDTGIQTELFNYFKGLEGCGYDAVKAAAAADGVPLIINEYGLFDEATTFAGLVLDWIYQSGAKWHSYWQGSHSGSSAKLEDNAAVQAAYKLRFGAPQITTSATSTSAENVNYDIALTTAYAQTTTWSIVSGGSFATIVSGSTLRVTGAPAGDKNITVRATNEFGLTSDLAITHTFTAPYVFTNTEASDAVARMSGVDETVKPYFDTWVGALKAGAISGSNIFNKLRFVHVHVGLGSQANSQKDWKGTTYDDLTVSGTLSWSNTDGFSFLGTGYLSTGLLSSALTPAGQNTFCAFSWEKTNVSQNNGGMGNGSSIALCARTSSDTIGSFVFDFSTLAVSSITDSRGFTSWNRSSSSARQTYKNGVQVLSETTGVTSSGGTAATFVVGASTAAFPSSRVMMCDGVASTLTANEQKDLYNAFRALFVSLGVINAGDFAVAT